MKYTGGYEQVMGLRHRVVPNELAHIFNTLMWSDIDRGLRDYEHEKSFMLYDMVREFRKAFRKAKDGEDDWWK